MNVRGNFPENKRALLATAAWRAAAIQEERGWAPVDVCGYDRRAFSMHREAHEQAPRMRFRSEQLHRRNRAAAIFTGQIWRISSIYMRDSTEKSGKARPLGIISATSSAAGQIGSAINERHCTRRIRASVQCRLRKARRVYCTANFC